MVSTGLRLAAALSADCDRRIYDEIRMEIRLEDD